MTVTEQNTVINVHNKLQENDKRSSKFQYETHRSLTVQFYLIFV